MEAYEKTNPERREIFKIIDNILHNLESELQAELGRVLDKNCQAFEGRARLSQEIVNDCSPLKSSPSICDETIDVGNVARKLSFSDMSPSRV